MFHKLMNNAVYGKTMENLKNRFDIRLLSNEKDHSKLISKPNRVPCISRKSW